MNPRWCLALGLLASWSLVGRVAAAQAPLPPAAQLVVDPHWPQAPHGPWGALAGIAVDTHDQVYVFTRSQPALQIYRRDGSPAGSWPMESTDGAHYVRIAPDGHLWLVDFRKHVVEKFDPQGKRLLRLGQWGSPGSDAQHFNSPTDVAVLPGGDAFVTDGYGNRRVMHFDGQGRFVKQWGSAGTGPGQFALPHSIVADSRGRLVVADRDNGRIQVFDTQGQLLAVWNREIIPWGLYLTPGDRIWVCGSSRVRKAQGEGWTVLPPPDQLLMCFGPEGQVLTRVPLVKTAVPPGKPGELDWVHSIAVDSQGAIYLGDIQGKRVQRFLLR